MPSGLLVVGRQPGQKGDDASCVELLSRTFGWVVTWTRKNGKNLVQGGFGIGTWTSFADMDTKY